MSFLRPSTFLLTLLTVSSSLACGPAARHPARELADRGHHQHQRRATSASTSKAATSTTSANVATSTDANFECTAYDFPVVDAIANKFPAIWVNAQIVANDTAALNAFKALEPLIPNITVKGTPAGNFAASDSYPSTDPDCWWTDTLCTTPKHPGLPPDIVDCQENDVYGYTFDDGPNCSHNAFYDYLLSVNQKASMFFIGSNVMDWPIQAQRALQDGHEICVHTWSHPYMTGMSNEGVFAELYYTTQIIKAVIGVTPRCWRPPFGDIDDRVRFIASALGLASVLWLEDTDDWNYAAVGVAQINQNYQNIVDKGTNGTYNHGTGPIGLEHEIDGETMSLAQTWHPKLAAAYSHLTPVNVCRNNTRPYVEQEYQYPDFIEYIAGTTTIPGNPAPTAVSTLVMSPPYSSGQAIPSLLPYDLATTAVGVTTAAATTTATGSSMKPTGTSSSGSSKETGQSAASNSKNGAVGRLTGGGLWVGVVVGLGMGVMML